jgi:hypothetical protein
LTLAAFPVLPLPGAVLEGALALAPELAVPVVLPPP